MRSIWTGSISFGLVEIQVNLYSVAKQQKQGFRLLHKKDHTPIKYKRWCPKHNKEIPWEDIAKGFEISKNKYYMLEKDELESLKPEKTSTIDIIEIVDSRQIDQIYFDHHYFLGPAKEKEKAYFLLKEVLQQSAKAAIGRFVMREKEYICSIESYKTGLLLTTLNYASDVRDINEIDFIEHRSVLKELEIELAVQLISKLQKKEFDITEFKDTFMEEIKKLVEKKMNGEIVSLPKPRKKGKNLIEALKASL
jgi:DNA end-binding protein Ku